MKNSLVMAFLAVFMVSCNLFTTNISKSEITLKKVFHSKLDTARSVKFSPDGKYFLSGVDSYFAIYVWNTKDMSLFKMIYLDDKYRNQLPQKNRRYRAYDAHFTPDSKSIYVALNNGVALILSLESDAIKIYDFKVDQGSNPLSAISKSGKILVLGGRYFNTETNKLVNTNTTVRSELAITQDDKYIVSSFYFFSCVNIFNTTTEERTNLEIPSLFGETNIYSIDLSPDNDTIAASQRNGDVRFYSIRQKAEIGRISHGGSNVKARFSPDGKFLASGSDNKKVKLWDIATLKRKNTWKSDGRVWFINWLQGTSWIGAGTDKGELMILSTEKKEPIFRGKIMENAIRDIDYLHSKHLLLVCDNWGNVAAFKIQ